MTSLDTFGYNTALLSLSRTVWRSMWQIWLKLRKGPPTWLSIMSSSFIQLLFYFLMWCIGYITCLIITKNCKETEIYKVAIKNLQSTQWLKIPEKVSFYTITLISKFKLFLIFPPKIWFSHFVGDFQTVCKQFVFPINFSFEEISDVHLHSPPCQLSLYEKVFREKKAKVVSVL